MIVNDHLLPLVMVFATGGALSYLLSRSHYSDLKEFSAMTVSTAVQAAIDAAFSELKSKWAAYAEAQKGAGYDAGYAQGKLDATTEVVADDSDAAAAITAAASAAEPPAGS